MAPYGDKVWNQSKYRSDFKNAYLKLCRIWSHLRYCHLYFSIFVVQLSVEEEWIQPKFVRHKASAFSELSRACLRSSECVIKCHYVVFVWSKHVSCEVNWGKHLSQKPKCWVAKNAAHVSSLTPDTQKFLVGSITLVASKILLWGFFSVWLLDNKNENARFWTKKLQPVNKRQRNA